MSSRSLGPGPNTKVRRGPEKANYDADVIYEILDNAHFCTVAGIVNGCAMCLPSLHARAGRILYLHGSKSNAIMKSILDAGRACVSVTIYDGLRIARSGFESSISYRSVVVVGAATVVEDDEEKSRALDLFVDTVLPGRAKEVRPMNEQEMRLTLVVAVEIEEASAKISAGPTDDAGEDLELPIWSGTIPARLVFGEPVSSSDGAMASGAVPVPESVRRLLEQQQ
jgi:nitroimidazol reductase NimA-like FMN-containing flavoprotein (pyridoxamine 5'-phosphate oxidase superfamily)